MQSIKSLVATMVAKCKDNEDIQVDDIADIYETLDDIIDASTDDTLQQLWTALFKSIYEAKGVMEETLPELTALEKYVASM